jgi:hypothetical protein
VSFFRRSPLKTVEEFYLLFEAMLRGALHVQPQGIQSCYGDLFLGKYVPDEPIVCKRDIGSRAVDFVSSTYACNVFMSQRFVDVLRAAETTGWGTYPVEVYGKDGQFMEGYHGLSILGRCGPVDFAKGRLEFRPPRVPNGKPYKVRVGFPFDLATLDGSDFFSPEGTYYIVVTQKARDALVSAKLTGLRIVPASEFEMMVGSRQ